MSQTTANLLLRNRGCIAIVAPHPDDEVFGCGLLIAAARRARVRIVVIVLTDGRASHPRSVKWPVKKLIRLRQGETRRGLARLGANNAQLRFLGWHDGALDVQGRQHRLRAILTGLGVRIALVSSPRDFHPDHKAAFALVTRAAANTNISVGTYDVWSRVDLRYPSARDYGLAQKNWAALAHRSQLGDYITDDPRAFKMEARVRLTLVRTQEQYRSMSPTVPGRPLRKPRI